MRARARVCVCVSVCVFKNLYSMGSVETLARVRMNVLGSEGGAPHSGGVLRAPHAKAGLIAHNRNLFV